MSAKKAKEKDWFEALNVLIEKEKESYTKDLTTSLAKKNEICAVVLSDLVKVWQKFDDLRIFFTLEPDPQTFAIKNDITGQWELRPDYDFSAETSISLKDRTHEDGRIGDAIRMWFYNFEDTVMFRVAFEFCEGEHYYKYTGWKRTFAQHILYDAPLDKVRYDLLHEVFMDVFRKWFESHLKKDRNIIIKHIRDTYEKGESFTQ